MTLTITSTDKLRQRFNLLPETAEKSEFSIDEKLISAIEVNPDIELILNSNPEIASKPEKLYHKIISALSATFFEGDIQKIISTYFCWEIWKKWNESQKDLLIGMYSKESMRALDIAFDQVTGHKDENFGKESRERQ